MVWRGNNIFLSPTQGQGLNEGFFDALLSKIEGGYTDPWGYGAPEGYTPPTRLVGDPTDTYVPPNVQAPGGTPGGGNNGGAAVTPPPGVGAPTAGGSQQDQQGGMGGSREPGYGAGPQSGNGGSGGGDLMGALAGLFGAGLPDVFQFDPVASQYGAAGQLASVATGIPGLGIAGAGYGNYLDTQTAGDLYQGFTRGTNMPTPDYSWGSGLLNTMTLGLLGQSVNDQLAESVGLQSDRDIAEAMGVSDSLTGLGSVDVSFANEGPYSNLQTPSLSFGGTTTQNTTSPLDAMRAELMTLDPDSARAAQIQRDIADIERDMDNISRLGYGGQQSGGTGRSAVDIDRERDQSTGDASRQSGPR